ncbi:MAG: Na+/H+ antiporter subunit E [Deltaproteobacteria bacterium]|nr:Na+/H+ antiporter subunit E [Deltaproteobacteria bacterium]
MDIRNPRVAPHETPETRETDKSVPKSATRSTAAARLIAFFVLFALWILLSGRFDAFHLALGIISCAIVTLFSGDLLLPELQAGGLARSWARFAAYIPWLLFQILLANLHILYLVFHPRMMDLIDPQIIRFRSELKKELSLVAFANSITLTPGTITVYVSVDGDFKVHAIDGKSAESLPGEMESRIRKAFGEQ